MVQPQRGRSFWLDWVRILAMGTLFLFHSSRPFAPPAWHVMNSVIDPWFTLFDIFIAGWIMPLFFVISGIATYFSLAKRNSMRFVKDRFLRLMIPFFTVGLFGVLAVNMYYDAVFHGEYAGGFLGFYLGPYFTKFFPFTFDFSPTYFADSNQGIYLWYLFWLFVFSIITIPLFRWLRREQICIKISRLYSACNRRGGFLLLAIPVILVNIAAIPPYFVFPSGYGGGKLPMYLALFIIGYVIASSPSFEESIEKNRKVALLLGILSTVSIVGIVAMSGIPSPTSGVDAGYVVISTLWALNGWCWVAAIMGYGCKHLSFSHKFLHTANELVLPFYILHQAIIVAVSFYVVNFPLLTFEKYLLILLLAFPTITLLLYPISKLNALRFLFGMRLVRKSVVAEHS